MITETKKVLALVAVVVAAGVATVEMTRTPAHADPALVAGGAAGYAGQRVDGAFATIAEMPQVAALALPVAAKGDLGSDRCADPSLANFGPDCIDTAYQVQSGPFVVVEARGESSSILTRLMGLTVAGL